MFTVRGRIIHNKNDYDNRIIAGSNNDLNFTIIVVLEKKKRKISFRKSTAID